MPCLLQNLVVRARVVTIEPPTFLRRSPSWPAIRLVNGFPLGGLSTTPCRNDFRTLFQRTLCMCIPYLCGSLLRGRFSRLPGHCCAAIVIFAGCGLVAASDTPAGAASEETVSEGDANQDDPAMQVARQWQTQIRPLLAAHCVGCHGPAKRSGELALNSVAGLLHGGTQGSPIDEAKPATSLLLAVTATDAELHMPPEEQLPAALVRQLAAWVTQLAKLSPEQQAELDQLAKSLEQPHASTASPYPAGVEPQLVIDLAIQAGWQQSDPPVSPATVCDDATFVRRLYLDLVGRIPTAGEQQAFLGDPDSRKRAVLIDRLLETPEHARHLGEIFDAVLMGRSKPQVVKQREQHGWLRFLTAAVAQNRPWDEVARDVLLARPESAEDAGATWYLYERKNEHQQIAESVARGFFGVRIDCAQCHDHPLADEIKQAHYWGLVAFFNRGTNVDTKQGPRISEAAIGGFSNFTNLTGESQPNRLVFLQTDPIPEDRPPDGSEQADRDEFYAQTSDTKVRVPKFSRRQKFVDEVLAGHPLLARAMVNRLWALMMGRGLVHPVDALDSTHPPSHPELLDWLAEDFRRSNYDVRRLMAQLARSQTYQLESTTDRFVDPSHFAVAAVKPLTAESLYRSMLVALQIEATEERMSPANVADFRAAFPDVLPEESIASTRQALLLTNGSRFHELLSPEVAKTIRELLVIEDPRTLIDRAFGLIFGRAPIATEMAAAETFLTHHGELSQARVTAFVWALLTSAEFRFNH